MSDSKKHGTVGGKNTTLPTEPVKNVQGQPFGQQPGGPKGSHGHGTVGK